MALAGEKYNKKEECRHNSYHSNLSTDLQARTDR
jgi:hypothetical protein